jgi:hypothetical protein
MATLRNATENMSLDAVCHGRVRKRSGSLFRGALAGVLLSSLLASPVFARELTFTESRPAEVWRYYMHGITDGSAQRINLLSLLNEKTPREKWIVTDRPVSTPFFQSDAPSLKIAGGEKLSLPRPLPIDLGAARGKNVRVFVWIAGENTGRENSPNSYSDPPSMLLVLKDAKGRTLAVTSSLSGSTGTFPWHCYCKEFFVPEETAAIYAKFYNNHGGPAFFSNLSWEVASREYSNNERQDPTTGSWASNPWHDEMNQQFRFIKGYDVNRYPWRFFEGPAAGLVAQKYNIATVDGLRKYFHQKVKTDYDHMNHALMYFASRYHYGRANGLLPESMNEKWLEELSRLVIEDQDPDTGYWGRSMGVTFHYLDGLFAGPGYDRMRDGEDGGNANRHIGGEEIPRAERIIETTLSMQAQRPDDPETLAAWPQGAYNFTDAPNASRNRASLVVTGNAIDILRRCERFANESLRERVRAAVRQAVGYALDQCVDEDGAWRQSDTAANPSTSGHMPRILSASWYLERVLKPDLPAPRLAAQRGPDGSVAVAWESPEEGQNSVRLFLLDEGTPFENADSGDLCGILQRHGGKIAQCDPFVVIRKMNDGAKRRWGKGWSADSYVGKKMPRPNLPVSIDGQSLQLPKLEGKKLWAVAATWYGEESKPVEVLLGL